MTSEVQNLTHSVPYHGTDQVHVGNGEGLHISSLGSAHFTSSYNSHTVLSLNNFLLVPNITKNLVSVSQFAKDNNCFFEFHPACCFVKSQGPNKVLLKGTLGRDGLYCFEDIHVLQSRNSTRDFSSACQRNLDNKAILNTVVSANSTFAMWHNRLGHAHSSYVKVVLDLCKIPYQSKVNGELCTACCLGKSHRLHARTSTH